MITATVWAVVFRARWRVDRTTVREIPILVMLLGLYGLACAEKRYPLACVVAVQAASHLVWMLTGAERWCDKPPVDPIACLLGLYVLVQATDRTATAWLSALCGLVGSWAYFSHWRGANLANSVAIKSMGLGALIPLARAQPP